MLSREISNPKFSIVTRHFDQVLNSQVAKRDVIPSNLNLAGSFKCSWLSSTLSGFSCLVFRVKMPLCSIPGCSNRSDKDPEKVEVVIICRLETKSWQKCGLTSFDGMHVL